MAKRKPTPEPKPRRIIVEERFGDWVAWFADNPEVAFGGDSPGTAVDRLWGNNLENVEAAASRDHG